MTVTIVVGDSVALGIGQALADTQPGVHFFARNGEVAGLPMQPHFGNALQCLWMARHGNPAETFDIFVSAGYNGGHLEELRPMLKALVEEGATVVLSGLRTEWPAEDSALKARFLPVTSLRNRFLKALAEETGALFAENTVPIANAIPGDEIHGNYAQLGAALQETARQARATTKEASC